jgi:NAD+ synthase
MLSISLCQLNPWVGHLPHNLHKIKAFYEQSFALGHDLVVFPECAVTGYPLEDLVLKPHFMEKVKDAVSQVVALTANQKTAILIGTPWIMEGGLYNCALFIRDGKIQQIIQKQELPNYGVFDEKRLFTPGVPSDPIVMNGISLGVLICEDMWEEAPARSLKARGADCLLVLNGSPFDVTKQDLRQEQARARICETGLPLIYVNLVGCQDSLVFDGHSFVMGLNQKIACQFPAFEENSYKLALEKTPTGMVFKGGQVVSHNDNMNLYRALVISLRDYVEKNGFKGVLLGLSGGIDSAISAAIAVDALGPDRVHCVMMPSPYTSVDSLDDGQAIAKLLGVSYSTIAISPAMEAFQGMLADHFQNKTADITEENIQSRSRGVILMALSNKLGLMVLSTGNKSEMAVGYATLYGDMCGGYNALKDVYKMQVFALSTWRNHNFHESFKGPNGAVMPDRVITKPPSAELRPDQKDQDSLPPYEILDDILYHLIEKDFSVKEIVDLGYHIDVVNHVSILLDRAEYKRRQSPPGPKITPKALSFERRYPITNGYSSDSRRSF